LINVICSLFSYLTILFFKLWFFRSFQVLGWEEFQVRDWESIKNIIALCFFIGNYFYEIESTLIEHPTIEIICQLGDGKGIVSRFYFLKGLKKLLIANSVFQFKEDKGISDDKWAEITDFAGI